MLSESWLWSVFCLISYPLKAFILKVVKPQVLFTQAAEGLMPMLDEVFDERLENNGIVSTPNGLWKTDRQKTGASTENVDKRKRSELEDDFSGTFKNVML